MSDDLIKKRHFAGTTSIKFDEDSEQILNNDLMDTKYNVVIVDNSERTLDNDLVSNKNSVNNLEQSLNIDLMDTERDPSQIKFSCAICDVTFNRKDNLRRHKKKFHSLDSNTTYTQICSVCYSKTRTISDLHKHIENEHPDIKLIFYDKLFYCQSDFEEWKDEIERQTVSRFVLNATKVNENTEVQYFRCHRSGFSKASENGAEKRKRRSKFGGTIKTGITCPAMIKTIKETVDEATQITTHFQSTHVGHKCEVGKLSLKKEERSKIADMLSSGMPINVVIDKTQAQFSPTKRLGLITRQDIYNVSRDFNVSSIHKDDALAVDITVKKEIDENIETNIILKQVNKKPRKDLDNKKLVIEQLMKNISNEVQSLESYKDLQYVKDKLKDIQAYLEEVQGSEMS